MTNDVKASNQQVPDDTLRAWLGNCVGLIESGVATDHIAVCPVALSKVIRELIQRRAVEMGCEHPLGRLFYHGFVSGRVGDYRCDQCQKVVYLPSLDAREWAAAREEFKATSPKTSVRHVLPGIDKPPQ